MVIKLSLRTTERVGMGRPLREYISENHIQDPALFSSDLIRIDQLRIRAATVTKPSMDGATALMGYIGQLSSLIGKFPVDVGIRFTWNNMVVGAPEPRTSSRNSLRYDLFNMLVNLGTVYFSLGSTMDRSSNDGLKQACSHFGMAAGLFRYVRTVVLADLRSPPPVELEGPTIETIELVMLALAQEAVWQKAVRDGLRDGTIAKLAAEVADRFGAAAVQAGKTTNNNGSGIDKKTRTSLIAKQFQFEASARYRMSQAALENKKFGPEVAWLQSAVEYIDKAVRNSSHLDGPVAADLAAAQKKMKADLKQAERDNDIIYLDVVPSVGDLGPIERVSMAGPRLPVELTDPAAHFGPNGSLGTQLFADLVPYAVTIAANMYNDMKTKLVDRIISDFRALTQTAHDQLSEMNLPGFLEAVEKPLGLPPSIAAHADEIRQADAVVQLGREIANTETVKVKCVDIFEAAMQELEAEEAEDQYLRTKFGTDRWQRQPSREANPGLFEQADDFGRYLETAGRSDRVISAKFGQQRRMLSLLAGPDSELAAFIPNSRAVNLSPELTSAVVELRKHLRKLTWLETQRHDLIDRLVMKSNQDEIKPELADECRRLCQSAPTARIDVVMLDPVLERRLDSYDDDEQSVGRERARQDDILSLVRKTNEVFSQEREKLHLTQSSDREVAIQHLEDAYFQYVELVANVNDARKFYNDLVSVVIGFRDGCREYVNGRRDDALELEAGMVGVPDDDDEEDDDDDPMCESDSEIGPALGTSHSRPSNFHNPPPPIVTAKPTTNTSGGSDGGNTTGRTGRLGKTGRPTTIPKPPTVRPTDSRNKGWQPGMQIRFAGP